MPDRGGKEIVKSYISKMNIHVHHNLYQLSTSSHNSVPQGTFFLLDLIYQLFYSGDRSVSSYIEGIIYLVDRSVKSIFQ